ncbi:MAG: alpha-L-fucosidase [Verrucomicrobiota bacterium]
MNTKLLIVYTLLHTSLFGERIARPPVPYDPSDYEHASEEQIEKFRDWKFGMRIHWGPYCLVDGKESHVLIPNRLNARKIHGDAQREFRYDYQQLYRSWNPTGFDAEEWIDLIELGGCRFFTFTTRHHDGFSMFDTQTKVKRRFSYRNPDVPDEIEECDLSYSIMETPFGRDVTRELCDAARKRGLGISLYYSHPDWYDADFRIDERHWFQDQNYTSETDPEGWNRMVNRHRQQLIELLSNYGRIDMISLDLWMPEIFYADIVETQKAIRKIQPHVMFRNRGIGSYGDYYTPERTLGKSNRGKPWSVIYPCSTNFSYMENDEYKPVSWIISSLIDSVAKGGNFQVAFGPPPNGKWQQEVVDRMKTTGQWMKTNGEAIYETRPRSGGKGSFKEDGFAKQNGSWEASEIYFTRSKDYKTIFALYIGEPAEAIRLSSIDPQEGATMTLFGSQREDPLEWRQTDDGLEINLPKDIASITPGIAYAIEISLPTPYPE